MWGTRGPCLLAAAMVVAVVMPVVFVVAWPEPKPLWSNEVALDVLPPGYPLCKFSMSM